MENKDKKRIKELETSRSIWVLILVITMVFYIILSFHSHNVHEQLQSCQEEVEFWDVGKGECIIYPWGIDFNVTKRECLSFVDRYERYGYVEWCVKENCEVIK